MKDVYKRQAYDSNEEGNEFWERRDFVLRKDLVYRSKDLVDLEAVSYTHL